MKFVRLVAFALTLPFLPFFHPASVFAAEWEYPKSSPFIGMTFPDSWQVELLEHGLIAKPGKNGTMMATLLVQRADQGGDDFAKAVSEFLQKQIQDDGSKQNMRQQDNDGLNLFVVSGTGIAKGDPAQSKVTFTHATFAVSPNRAGVVVLVGNSTGPNEDTINGIVDSLRTPR